MIQNSVTGIHQKYWRSILKNIGLSIIFETWISPISYLLLNVDIDFTSCLFQNTM